MLTLACIAITWQLEYYANIPCDCGPYTRRFSRGTLNCMDVLYCPTPTVVLYFNSKIINDKSKLKKKLISVS